jgi:hypothetical protein
MSPRVLNINLSLSFQTLGPAIIRPSDSFFGPVFGDLLHVER